MPKDISISISPGCVKKCIEWFDQNFAEEEKILIELFKMYPNNINFEQVFIKVNALNTLYSAGLNNLPPKLAMCCIKESKHVDRCDIPKSVDVIEMTNRIIKYNEEIDKWIQSKNENNEYLINEEQLKAVYYIATGIDDFEDYKKMINSDKRTLVKWYFSFASKYCSWHNPDCFPITDRYSRGMIYRIHHSNNNKFYSRAFSNLMQKNLNEYKDFCMVYRELYFFVKDPLMPWATDLPDECRKPRR